MPYAPEKPNLVPEIAPLPGVTRGPDVHEWN